MDVKDSVVEKNGILGNIMLFALLGVMSWVGLNIEAIKEDMAQARQIMVVNSTKIDRLEADRKSDVARFEKHLEHHK